MMRASGDATVGYVYSTGLVDDGGVYNAYGVRPVVSLANGTLVNFNGDGTSTNPYVVK